MTKVKIIGAGLAGSEAAFQLARRGFEVELYEMRPAVQTPAHQTGDFAELVCSNSLRAQSLGNAVGLLKEELRRMNSLIMEAADRTAIPAGGSLAVDREKFARYITQKIESEPLIKIIREEMRSIPEGPTIIAAGPLCGDSLARALADFTSEENLYFYDAAAPIVTYESIDFSHAFFGSRYEEDGGDYINCPMTKDEYDIFYKELINAEMAEIRDFESKKVFEGCMPIEEMARRGYQTMTFGPLKPVGLINPFESEMYAVVQLRQDNKSGSLYNMVGFQTRLTWAEQKRVFSLIPALKNAEFARYGVMHRNTYINAPRTLNIYSQSLKNVDIFFAGQLSGVEGYVESTASGLIAALNIARYVSGKKMLVWPEETALGALMSYLVNADASNFQPKNIMFGLLPSLDKKVRNRKERREKTSRRALKYLEDYIEENNLRGDSNV